jgi:hypothetical protein
LDLAAVRLGVTYLNLVAAVAALALLVLMLVHLKQALAALVNNIQFLVLQHFMLAVAAVAALAV